MSSFFRAIFFFSASFTLSPGKRLKSNIKTKRWHYEFFFVCVVLVALAGCASQIPQQYRVEPTVLECATMLYQEVQGLEIDTFKKDLTTRFKLSEEDVNAIITQLNDVESIHDAERFVTEYRVICNMVDMAVISLTVGWITGAFNSGSATTATPPTVTTIPMPPPVIPM